MSKYFKIFVVLSSLVLFVGVFVVVRELGKGREIRLPAAATYPGKLIFSPSTINVKPGQNFDQKISVNMDTGGKAVAHADIQISFDKAKLELIGITKETHGTYKTYTPVNTSGGFDSAKVISQANSTGLITFSILSFDWVTNTRKSPYNGTFSPLTKLSFKAKSGTSDTTQISFKYINEGETTDSNLVHKSSVSDPVDILANPTSKVKVNFISPTEAPTPIPNCSTPSPGITATCNGNYKNDLKCSWSGVSNATEYQGQIDNDSNFSPPLVDTVGSSTSRSIGNVTANRTYYCRSRVTKSNGSCTVDSKWSSVDTVKKACPTPTPTVTNTPTPTSQFSPTPTSSINQPPNAFSGVISTLPNTPIDIQLQFDDDGPGPYVYSITKNPTNGVLSGSSNDRTYAPNSGFTGVDSFRWKVNDSEYDSNIATITINVRDSLIANLSVSDSSNAADWSIQENLQPGAQQYGDRNFSFSSIPDTLTGNTWIRTANDSKSFTGTEIVKFDINRDATLYIAHDNRISPKPTWLSSWVNTGMNITNSEPQTFTIYSKDYSASSIVSLGPNGDTSKSMYTIIIDGKSITPGDANGDRVVDIKDYSVWVNQYGDVPQPDPSGNADLNNDNKVDGEDYIIWLSNYGN